MDDDRPDHPGPSDFNTPAGPPHAEGFHPSSSSPPDDRSPSDPRSAPGVPQNRRSHSSSHWEQQGDFDEGIANSDYQKALDGVKSGRYMSLRDVISHLGLPEGTRVISIDIKTDHGQDVYNMTIREPSGALKRFRINATTGDLLG
ncbi:hypothetical protein NAC44_04950 [Allorhizobium sp. BGMRC 0089]|uniref:PepSY domain-containing protein n=1 Tax=Allorhizobium sonneratiae TaxID=2934936 RepID=UPI002033B741|nr:hypothetical protein [Allorhizobium sonneratiae]MCM2291675.1 hypothetical protein [Allorhizobium sonneratiae]